MAPTIVDLRQHRAHEGAPPRLDARAFRQVAGMFTTGVTVVTSLRGEDARGMTANSFTSVSLDPLLVLVCVRRDSEMRRLVDLTHQFAVSVLAEDQQGIAAWFANAARPAGRAQFDGIEWVPGPATGSPVILGAAAWLECAVAQRVGAGDHLILIGRVLAMGRAEAATPLVLFDGAYQEVVPTPSMRSTA